MSPLADTYEERFASLLGRARGSDRPVDDPRPSGQGEGYYGPHQADAADFIDEASVLDGPGRFDSAPLPTYELAQRLRQQAAAAGRLDLVCQLARDAAAQGGVSLRFAADWSTGGISTTTAAFLYGALAVVCFDLLSVEEAQAMYRPWRAVITDGWPAGWGLED